VKSSVRSWFRINRWWLVVLPLGIAVVVSGSAERVKSNWYDVRLRHAVATAEPGRYLTVDRWNDGSTPRSFSVRLAGVETTSRMPPTGFEEKGEKPPKGAEALAVHLDWKADPSQLLAGCRIDLVDAEGRRYEVPDSFGSFDQCVPADHPGPLGPGAVDPDQQRPASWSTAPTFLVPQSLKVTEVRIWWTMPDYVALPAS
jgi:hypothetical protein